MKLSTRYRDALVFAFDLHEEQVRQGSGVPYVAHLIGVASLALEYGADEEEAIGALLHDAVEDQGGRPTLARIAATFGEKVAAIVEGCTDAIDPPKPPWRKRKEIYLQHLHSASRSIQLVSACDKLYNAGAIVSDYREVGDKIWTRFSGGRDGTLWYYRSLADTFPRDLRPAQELRRVVEELERLAASHASSRPEP